MKPPPFKYFAPGTLAEALELVHEYGYEAKLLAGGQSLIPTMNFRLAQPAVIIDLNRIEELDAIDVKEPGEVSFGAMTRQRAVEASQLVNEKIPLVAATMPYIAHPQIRNRGTLGGSIAHADPAAELPAIMVATQAAFRLQSVAGDRKLDAGSFFTGLFSTALEPDEILVEITIPHLGTRSGFAFHEVARRHGDYALVGVAVQLQLAQDKSCESLRIVFLSVGDGPVRALKAEQVLAGRRPDQKLIQAAAEVAANEDIDPPGDIHASSDFRRHLAKALTAQSLQEALERAV